MHLHDFQLHATDAVERLPAFSLATTLAWIGHHCNGTCPRQAFDERATLWLISPPAEGRPTGMRALVDVEITQRTWSPEQAVDILHRINECTARDRIHARERSAADRFVNGPVSSWLSDVVAP